VSGFPPVDAFLIIVSMRKRCTKNNAAFKCKQRDIVNKAKPHAPSFSCCGRNLKFKKTIGCE
jgi:hypothetical protein